MKRGPKPGISTRGGVGSRSRADVKAGAPPTPDPEELGGEAAAEWNRVVPELDAAGVLSVVDRAALVAYCLAWSDLAAARDILAREGLLTSEPIQNSRGETIGERRKLHPAHQLHERAFRRVRSLLAELGLTPASRQRLEGPAHEANAGNNRVLGLRERIAQIRAGQR